MVSDIQRERQEMLDIFESPYILPIDQFAKFAVKSRDRNREIKAGKLLALGMGNRGQRIPGWHLNVIKSQLILHLLNRSVDVDVWALYKALRMPRKLLKGCSGIEIVSPDNVHEIAQIVANDMR